MKYLFSLLAGLLSFSAWAQVSVYTTFPDQRFGGYTYPAPNTFYTTPATSFYTPYYQTPYSTNRTIMYPTTTSTTYWYNNQPYNYNHYYHQVGSGCTMVAGTIVCY